MMQRHQTLLLFKKEIISSSWVLEKISPMFFSGHAHVLISIDEWNCHWWILHLSGYLEVHVEASLMQILYLLIGRTWRFKGNMGSVVVWITNILNVKIVSAQQKIKLIQTTDLYQSPYQPSLQRPGALTMKLLRWYPYHRMQIPTTQVEWQRDQRTVIIELLIIKMRLKPWFFLRMWMLLSVKIMVLYLQYNNSQRLPNDPWS